MFFFSRTPTHRLKKDYNTRLRRRIEPSLCSV